MIRFLNSYEKEEDRNEICQTLRPFQVRILIYGDSSRVVQPNDVFQKLESYIVSNLNKNNTLVLTTGSSSIDHYVEHIALAQEISVFSCIDQDIENNRSNTELRNSLLLRLATHIIFVKSANECLVRNTDSLYARASKAGTPISFL